MIENRISIDGSSSKGGGEQLVSEIYFKQKLEGAAVYKTINHFNRYFGL
jgi:hypothetical protein